jgi:hypothetical protein
LVDRAPGNFHIQAQSKGHDLAAHMTNVSHIINHLSFGKPFSKYFIKEGLKNTPEGFLETTRPFDGNVYVTSNVHEAHHHYLKIITTDFDAEKNKKKAVNKNFYKPQEPNRAYQILQSSQLSLYKADIIPGKLCVKLSLICYRYMFITHILYFSLSQQRPSLLMIYHQLLCPTIRSLEPGMIILHHLWPLLGERLQESPCLYCFMYAYVI